MNNKYAIFAILAMVIVFGSYIGYFYGALNYEVSDDVGDWALLGDYAGGLLNPVLSFISLILLIKSLNLQNQANLDLRAELSINERTEKLRSFETHFFNMLNSQHVAYESFNLDFHSQSSIVNLKGVEAVMELEDRVEHIIANSGDRDTGEQNVKKLVELLDRKDKLFSTVRIFCIIVKLVDDKLCDSDNFTNEDRKNHYRTLINFTDFSLLRLIMLCIQFMECHPTEYLKENQAFNEVLEEVGLNYNLY